MSLSARLRGQILNRPVISVASKHILIPQQLAHEFVTRSAAGEFSRSEDWLPGAVDCPGHEPGYDLFQVVAAYSSKPIYTGADTVRYELTLRRVGVMSNGFHREAGVEVDTFTLYRTPFGWRIVSPGPWAWITVEAAVSRGWIGHRSIRSAVRRLTCA